jgi:hypothetical protein
MSKPVAMHQANPSEDLLDRALRGSVGGRLVSAAAAAAAAAWARSVSKRYVTGGVTNWRTLPPSARIRMIALAGATAVFVHLVMSRLGTAEPLGAVVPFCVLAACAVAALLAGPIARASERRKR